MRACLIPELLPFTRRFEGHTTWFYLDVKGLVTIGYGQLCDPVIPDGLDFGGATQDEVHAAWLTVHALQAARKQGGGAFERITTVRATEQSIDMLFRAKMVSNWHQILGYFPDAEDWCADAQLGSLSLAWACGGAFADPRNPRGFPRWAAAARRRDWLVCAEECRIDETGNPGVVDRNHANRTLFTCAAYTTTPNILSAT